MESLFTVFRMLKLGKNYQVKVEIADSKRNCRKSWVHIYFRGVFFPYNYVDKILRNIQRKMYLVCPCNFLEAVHTNIPWSWRVLWRALVESFWGSFTLKRLKRSNPVVKLNFEFKKKIMFLEKLIFVFFFGVQSVLVSSKSKAFSKLKFRSSPAVAPFDSRTGRRFTFIWF